MQKIYSLRISVYNGSHELGSYIDAVATQYAKDRLRVSATPMNMEILTKHTNKLIFTSHALVHGWNGKNPAISLHFKECRGDRRTINGVNFFEGQSDQIVKTDLILSIFDRLSTQDIPVL